MTTQMIPAETVQATMSPYSMTVRFCLPQVQEPVVAVVLPLPVAKQLAMILRRLLKQHETARGVIEIPPESYQTMGVAPEDWGIETPPPK